MEKFHSLRLILGDQLNSNHSWYQKVDDGVLYLIAELHQEADYVKHHIQKISAFFLAMENFASSLQAAGHQVKYLTLDKSGKYRDLNDLISQLCRQYEIENFQYQQPDEYRLAQQLENLSLPSIEISSCDTEHFLLPREEISQYIKPAKHNRMESFYRKMRVRFNLLMDDDQPRGGRWNFDGENRQKLKPADIAALPEPLLFANPAGKILKRIKAHNISTIGHTTGSLLWPVNRQQSLQLLQFFCDHCLPNFGRFQDAMTGQTDKRWSLYHSRISFALNSKMLHPMEVVEAAIRRFERDKSVVDLAQIEGFIRQIIGWRNIFALSTGPICPTTLNSMSCGKPRSSRLLLEWRNQDGLHEAGNRPVPGICLRAPYTAADGDRQLAMLTGIDPHQLDQWYLGIYIDAIEWVEMPNTRGMSQFADGGLIATKPYAASGSYINKMSDHCKDCYYSVKERYTEQACPLTVSTGTLCTATGNALPKFAHCNGLPQLE